MTLWEGLGQAVADGLNACLNDVQKARATALILTHTAMPDADAFDRIRMARYIVTGFEDPPEVDQIRTASGELIAVIAHEDRVEPAEAVAEHPDDPGPQEPSGEIPDLSGAEPAPMAGTHWQGHRGAPPV